VSDVEEESLRMGLDGGRGRKEGLERWKAMFGFVGDSTKSEAEADVEPDKDEATHV